MKTVYFVRHGESIGNVSHVYQNPEDPLTERGREQGAVVAERCTKLPIEVVISSTMRRAAETAELICARSGHSLELSELFIERYRPEELRGRSRKERQANPIAKAWHESIFHNGPRISDGENFNDIKIRAGKALDFLQHHPAQNMLVVTHGFFLRFLLTRLMFGEAMTTADLKHVIDSVRTNNTGITAFQYGTHPKENDSGREGEYWILRAWNDHAHLG